MARFQTDSGICVPLADRGTPSATISMLVQLRAARERKKLSGAVRRASRALFAAVYVIALGEVFLRYLAPVPLFPRHVCATSYGIRNNEPNQRYWHISRDVCVEFRTNSKGLRADREIDYAKPVTVKRIVILGDSFGMGYEVSVEDSFASRLEDALNSAGVPTEVINLSVSGYGTAEELIMLREEGLRYEPDLVLVAWHASDISDNVRSELFGMKEGRLVRCAVNYLPGIEIKRTLDRTIVYPWISEHSMLHAWLREGVTGRARTLLAQLRGGPLNDEELDITQPGMPRGWQELTVALLNEIGAVATSHGASLVVLDIPVRRSRTEFVSRFPQVGGLSPSIFLWSPLTMFSRHRGELLYWENSQGHFTPLACRIIGESLAEYVVEHSLLGARVMAQDDVE